MVGKRIPLDLDRSVLILPPIFVLASALRLRASEET